MAVFEVDPKKPTDENGKNQIKLSWAVSCYKRPAADVKLDDPNFLRPLPVLKQTLDYLLEEILNTD